MTDETDKPAEGFAGRWSRLKAEARAAKPVEPAVDALPQAHEPAELPAEAKPVELPPLETLTRDSDYSLFMRGDVAADLRTQALRKLWTLDPHFAAIDITECHSIDFNAVQCFPEGLKNTIYRVGSGMVEAVEEIERAEAAEKARLAAATEKRVDSAQAEVVPADEPPKEAS
ncbi:MAG: DUF3306 domain-containing protein [Rhodospirillales bacterium]|nr:DUF3306 domain-containing protein [Rhodospirillales bacterium]